MAGTESTVENNPFKHTSDVRKADAQSRLRGYEYYVRDEILQSLHAYVFIIVLQYNTSALQYDLFLQKGTAREDSDCAISSESAFLQL